MHIANPIYDVVFRFLVEDLEIARGLISQIIGRKILKLSLSSQEYSYYSKATGLTVIRIDFSAIIEGENGEQEKVLIELQKTLSIADIVRFRTYLGKNYMMVDRVAEEEKGKTHPIITIYFWGINCRMFRLLYCTLNAVILI